MMFSFIQKVVENDLSEEEKLDLLVQSAEEEMSPEELADIVRYLKKFQTIELSFPEALDICGTGGSGLPRINTSTLTALLLAQEGIKVTKHGNKAATGRFGSFDLLEGLGYQLEQTKEIILQEYEQKHIAFLYARQLFPVIGKFAQVRQRYGKPTIFNILGPLLNPANTDMQIIGCSFQDKMELMVQTAKLLGKKHVAVLRGEDGLDEVTLTGKTEVYALHDAEIQYYFVSPEDFGYTPCDFDEIAGGHAETNIQIAKDILAGTCTSKHRELVGINVDFARSFISNS